MSTVLTDKIKDKIKDYIANQCCQDMIADYQYDLLCDYINNDDHLYDYVQEWLWAGVDFSKANEPGFPAKVGQQMIEKQILYDVREELIKCSRERVRKALEEWLDYFKE